MADDNKAGAAASSEGTAGGGTATTGTAATTTTPTGEQKPADTTGTPAATGTEQKKEGEGKAGEETGGKAGAETAPKAPAKYELKVPEAAADYVTPELQARIEARSRELDLTQEDAQAYLDDVAAEAASEAAARLAITKADKEFGGDNLAATQTLANSVIDRVYPKGHARRDAFLSFMRRTGAGNSIEVVAFLANLGKQLAEDSPGQTRSAVQAGGNVLDKMYDHPTSKIEG